jgi:hypothetical protein
MLTNADSNYTDIKKCSKCGCKKLLTLFSKWENTGKYYKCCDKCRKKKCKCGTIPYFGLLTDKKPTCCSKCKTKDMVDIKNKKCKCGKVRPCFGLPTDKRPTCCVKCKDEYMVNIKDKKCKCGKSQPGFGLITDKNPTCCFKCKTKDMVNIKNKQCKCGKVRPSFGLLTDKRPTCCVKCKTESMVDISHKKCKTHLCEIRGNSKYKGYCSRCFFYTFPDQKLTRNYKTKENITAEFVKETYKDFDWILDRIVKGGCSRKRPDIYCDFGSHIVIVEVDEYSHTGYSCENKRMMTISKDFGHRPCIFVRFNPDHYISEKTGKKVHSCFVVKRDTGKMEIKSEAQWKIRLNKLKETLDKYTNDFETTKTLEVVELFYN